MTLPEIENIVKDRATKAYNVTLSDGKRKVVRLWMDDIYGVCVMGKRKKRYGRKLTRGYDGYDEWVSLRLVEHNEIDYFKRFVKRAADALNLLSESGLWKDIKESLEHFFELPEAEQRELVNDIMTDSYERFYKQTWEGGKYAWVHCHQIFYAFTHKTCWKSIAWNKWERKRMSEEVAECIKNGTDFHRRWENGYDNTLTITFNDDYPRGWYSCEYRGCANGHYYLMFDATHAIFYEDD
jgi:hypothetical protein